MGEINPDHYFSLLSSDKDLQKYLEHWMNKHKNNGMSFLCCCLLDLSIELSVEVLGTEGTKNDISHIFESIESRDNNEFLKS